MSSLPRNASTSVCQQIVDALGDPRRRFFDQKTSSRRLLDCWDLKPDGFFSDLAARLTADLLFLKPKTFPNQAQRYQCILSYPEESGCPELDIHVTLSPIGDPPTVMIAVHKSDTVQTLPRIHVKPNPDENEDQEP
jgi:hypothetical protein